MIRHLRQTSGPLRHVFLTLAVLALTLKILVPPGFMLAEPTNDLPFALVLCTSEGAVVVDSGKALPHQGGSDQAPDQVAHDSPCAFAGHGLAAAPPVLLDGGAPQFFAYETRATQPAPDLVPGRGLAGPPLPARGPPTLLI